MAKWRAGPERAYVSLPHRDDPRERVTRFYREGDVFDLPDNMWPSRTWYPKDAAALEICKKIVAGKMPGPDGKPRLPHMREEPEMPDDMDDERKSAAYRRKLHRWTMEQDAQRTWFGPDPYDDAVRVSADAPPTLHEMAKAAGKSVRASDQAI